MKIVIIDDDSLVRNALKTIIETGDIEVLATGSSGKEAIDLYAKFKPDILLMDIRMEDILGIDAAEIILSKFSDAKILFLTTFEDDEYIIKAIKIGAKGYILKQNFENIIPALNSVYSSQSVFGEKIIDKLPELIYSNLKQNISKYNLSDKDIELIELISEGLSNKEISHKLYLSEGTIRNYISELMDKLSLKSRTQIVAFYYTNLK